MQKQLLIPTQEPQIQIINGEAKTSSLDVAEFFGKRHDHVLRDIRKLIEDEPEFCLPNFGECEIIRDIPLQGEKAMAAYTMTRDGFTFLVMGYTGEKARKFKITYIQAFNAMEAELSNNPLQLDALSTVKDRKKLTNLLNALVSIAPVSYRDARHMLYAHIGVEHADEIRLSQIQPSIDFVQSKIDLYCATPEVDFITRQALAGVKAFTARLTVEEAVSKTAKAVHREFKANIYIVEEKPKHEISVQIDTMLSRHNRNLDRAGIR